MLGNKSPSRDIKKQFPARRVALSRKSFSEVLDEELRASPPWRLAKRRTAEAKQSA
jgi:hypothetical protein